MENSTASIPTNAVLTVNKTCLKTDGHALLCVRAGVPVELALEQATTLLGCMAQLIMSREPRGKEVQTAALQYLNDITRALVSSSFDGLCAYEKTLAA
ncbi:MAG: DUF3077 domain-containing protein [Pseudomonas sp.]|uniref:DUF3077 domain-containing protein n=1 Tax=Pseudomonas sp. TaxID=306 RepID=UPI0030F086D0